jgi:hypothetical protein
MKLPRHGMLIDLDTGKPAWIFTRGDPQAEVDEIAPMTHVLDRDGNVVDVVSHAPERSVVLDLEQALTPQEMMELHKDARSLRIRRNQNGQWEFKRVLKDEDGEELELDHDIMVMRQWREAKRKSPPPSHQPNTGPRASRWILSNGKVQLREG